MNGFWALTVDIILPAAFTMITIENYIFILKGLTVAFPHRCPTLYKWGLETMSALRWNPTNPISITKSTKRNILHPNTRKSIRKK
jgi:hypothetical protein